MSDERDRFLENEEPEVEDTEVEAHKFAANDEGDEPDVEAHKYAANDEGDDEPDVEAHKHSGVNRPATP